MAIFNNKLDLIANYNKVNLVPFGEFTPLESILSLIGLKTLTNNYQSFSSGDARIPLNIKNGKIDLTLLPLICYEIIYSGKLSKDNNFDYIVNISEDGWFGNSVGPKQHFSHSIFRSIESGKYIIRSANNGISAVINPIGIVEQKVEFGSTGYVELSESKLVKSTPFMLYGNKIFLMLILIYIFLIFSFNRLKHMSNLKNFLFTSESVSEGHPDKVSDRISDMVVDSYLAGDPFSRVACETLTTTNKVVLAGEVRGPEIKEEELFQKVRDCIKDIGYDQDGFTWREATKIESHLHSQSADIAMGVDSKENKDEGAGDQGIMFGYACNETEELMPAPIHYSHKILRLMAEDRKSGKLKNIEPDSKSQVTFEYIDGKPTKVKSVVISSQHSADVDQAKVRELLKPYLLKSIPEKFLKDFNEEEFYVNPTGNFVIGGPDGDCGLTGRKIIVDTYGGAAPHGGGAFSGKDPTKVDRSAAYAARYIAKNIVASGMLKNV